MVNNATRDLGVTGFRLTEGVPSRPYPDIIKKLLTGA